MYCTLEQTLAKTLDLAEANMNMIPKYLHYSELGMDVRTYGTTPDVTGSDRNDAVIIGNELSI